MTTEIEGSTNHVCKCENAAACVSCSTVNNKPLSPVIDAEFSQAQREARMRDELREVEEEITAEYTRVMKQFDHDTAKLRWKKECLEHALLQFHRPGCFGAWNYGVAATRCDTCKHGNDCYHADEARRGDI